MLLTILIPTYNRENFLKKNCADIAEMICSNGLESEVGLVISNNASTDGTGQFLDAFKDSAKINVNVIHQAENIGSVNNVLFLLKHSDTKYILFLGDDDFLHSDYLSEVVSAIKNIKSNISAIIPSNIAVSESGEELGYSRDTHLETKVYSTGFASCLANSWRGHQLSGLVFRREGLWDLCETNNITNMYLFIYLVAVSCLRGRVVHLTSLPVKISRPTQEAKGWSYDADGLISHIFDNYKKLEGISFIQRMRLELKVLDEQYWRYMMYLKKGFGAFIRAMWKIVTGKNTSKPTKFLFPLLMPLFLLKRIIVLAHTGKLIKTLNRTVDI